MGLLDQTFYTFCDPNHRGLSALVQPVNMVSNPTHNGLSAKGSACLHDLPPHPHETVGLGYRLFIWFLILLTGDCWPGVQHAYAVSDPTNSGLFIRHQNPSPGDCLPWVQPVYTVSEAITWALSALCAEYVYGVRNHSSWD